MILKKDKDMFKTSIVIPAYNGKEYLSDNLPLVVGLGADEIVIVDDASTDGSADYIAKNYPQVKLIRHSQNLRFPISVNDGFKSSSGDIIFLLNQDLKPQKDLIIKTLTHFKNENIFAVTFNENNRSWADGDWKNGMLEFKNGEIDNKIHESLWASGGSAAFRKDLWDKLGGFDPVFSPGYFEDLDLGLRVRKAGYKIIWDPKCKVEHVTETTFSKTFDKKTLTRIKDRNYLLTVWKNLPSGHLFMHLTSLTKRITQHPGYLVPVLMAILKRICY